MNKASAIISTKFARFSSVSTGKATCPRQNYAKTSPILQFGITFCSRHTEHETWRMRERGGGEMHLEEAPPPSSSRRRHQTRTLERKRGFGCGQVGDGKGRGETEEDMQEGGVGDAPAAIDGGSRGSAVTVVAHAHEGQGRRRRRETHATEFCSTPRPRIFFLTHGSTGFHLRYTATHCLPNAVLARGGELSPAWASFHVRRVLGPKPRRSMASQTRPDGSPASMYERYC